jgi:hypothetical protein
MAECRADLFDTPDRAPLVELSLLANECRSGAFENPDVVVGGLLADHGGDHSGQPRVQREGQSQCPYARFPPL